MKYATLVKKVLYSSRFSINRCRKCCVYNMKGRKMTQIKNKPLRIGTAADGLL